MAKFIPELDFIKKEMNILVTEGELYLLEQLSNLNNDYTVYFKPFLNGNNPDIMILKKSEGIFIIEVEDYDLNNCQHLNTHNSEFGKFVFTNDSESYSTFTPMEVTSICKQYLYDSYLPELSIANILNSKNFGLVKTGVFFYNSNTDLIKNKLLNTMYNNSHENPFLFYKTYTIIWGSNSNILQYFNNLPVYHNSFFTSQMFEEAKDVFNPIVNIKNQGDTIKLDERQNLCSISTAGSSKIKGISGSGKTIILAKRVLNAFERTGERILILTYNITLINYISASMSNFKTYNKNNFIIQNVHSFFYDMVKLIKSDNININTNIIDNDDNIEDPNSLNKSICILENLKIPKKYKFKTIIIDEAQDFQYNWLVAIKKFFLIDTPEEDNELKNKGEYILFADENQNIYSRELDIDKKVKTNIRGPWKALNTSYRVSSRILNLSLKFQEKFMSNTYELQSNIIPDEKTKISDSTIRRYTIDVSNRKELLDLIVTIKERLEIPLETIAILSPSIEPLRKLDTDLNSKQIYCSTTFEKENEYNKIAKKYNLNNDTDKKKFEMDLSKIRRTKKLAFNMNDNFIKLSTIHSFKGWEITTLFLIIDTNSLTLDNIDELIYTAITRCKQNLIIIDSGNNKYNDFFEKTIE